MLTPERKMDEVRPRTWAVRIVLSIVCETSDVQ